jgi:hypothetical protein
MENDKLNEKNPCCHSSSLKKSRQFKAARALDHRIALHRGWHGWVVASRIIEESLESNPSTTTFLVNTTPQLCIPLSSSNTVDAV